MLFSSVPFLFYFLPCVLLVYFLVPGTLKNGVLLLASLLFYGWGADLFVWKDSAEDPHRHQNFGGSQHEKVSGNAARGICS